MLTIIVLYGCSVTRYCLALRYSSTQLLTISAFDVPNSLHAFLKAASEFSGSRIVVATVALEDVVDFN